MFTHQMIKHGYFLLIIKGNLKLDLLKAQKMLLPVGLILSINFFYQRLEKDLIYKLLKTGKVIHI
jgi:hypothetical protein